MEKPKLQIKEYLAYPPIWITSFIAVAIAYFFSGQKLHFLPLITALLIIILVPVFVSIIFYVIKYIYFIIRVVKNYNRILELFSKKESEVVERDNIIRSHRPQILRSFELGTIKGRAIIYNESFIELMNRDIDILEKLPGENGGIELLFGFDTGTVIEEKMLLSIVTKYGESLRGVVEITEVQEKVCKGIVITQVNRDFWIEVEKDIYSNSAPPVDVKARLYRCKDLESELELMREKEIQG